jgi:hypothetical protein
MNYAFVIKNYSPIFFKVEILHKEYGKINCIYSKDDQARLLTTGSLIACSVENFNYSYRLNSLEILTTSVTTDIDHLEFIHQIALICIKLLPKRVAVDDVFNFLIYVYKNIDHLNEYSRKIILLRLFFLCEIFDGSLDVYKVAMQDPFDKPSNDIQYLNKYVQIGLHKLFQEKNNSFF